MVEIEEHTGPIFIGIIIIVILLVGGVLYVSSQSGDPAAGQVSNTSRVSLVPSPPAIVNASTPTPSPSPEPSPPPRVWENYEDWVIWVTNQYYHGVKPSPMPHLDPLSLEAWELWKEEQRRLASVTPRPFDGAPYGSRIYMPTPTPLPTPTPMPDPTLEEVHHPLRDYPPYNEFLAPEQYNSINGNESLFWNIYNARGVYPFYHNDPNYCDEPVLQLTFLSRYLEEVRDPFVSITLERSSVNPVYGIVWTNALPGPLEFAYPVTIPKPYWNYDHTAFQYSQVTITKAIPSSALQWLEDGTYRLHVQIYTPDKSVRLGEVWRQVTIF